MNVLDLLLIVAALGFAVTGYRQGFVVGVLSVLGFLGGGLIAVQLLPLLLRHLDPGTVASVVAVLVVIVFAAIGQAVTTHFGWKLRGHIGRRPARALDAVGGSVVNVISMLLVAWLIGSALAGTSMPTVSKQVRSSQVLGGVQATLPASAPNWFRDFTQALARNGFPQVFNPFEREQITEVSPPDPALAASPVVTRARQSLVKVVGTATACGKTLEGTGFVFAPHRVMTNAHVVGGVDEPTVQIGGTGKLYDATVVRYDWQRDIAVLDVPKLDAPALEFVADEAKSNDSAIVAGFPENGAFNVQPARVRGRIKATGSDIYHRGQVVRDIYSIRSLVRQGNSGGPLLSPEGKVFGVVFAKSLDSSDTGYVLTAAEVQAEAAAGAAATGRVDTEGCAL